MKEMPDKFYLVYPEPECVNVCFWYIPERLRNVPHSPERAAELGRVSRYFQSLELCDNERYISDYGHPQRKNDEFGNTDDKLPATR